jgi:hypothetical protein
MAKTPASSMALTTTEFVSVWQPGFSVTTKGATRIADIDVHVALLNVCNGVESGR